nr:uncharacterized protein LOC127347678 [Lolium perenne]
MDDPDYWKDIHDPDIQEIIYGGDFQTQPTPVSVDDFDDAPTQPDIAQKKKGKSLRTQGFVDDEDKWEKDQHIRQHQEELSAHKTSYQELKSQLIQLGLDHAKALKAAEANAAAKLDEALEDASNATVVLRAELEELAKARKGAEEKAARLEEEHKECNQLILQTDALAYRLFPDSQKYAVKKVDARRKDQGQANLTVPWTPNDHLVALNARVSHMRAIDRNLSDIPDVATQLFRTLWPGEEVPDTFSLISDRLKGAD